MNKNIFMPICLIIIFVSIAIFDKNIFLDVLNRIGMNGILVLSMVPTICCGIGPNFGMSIGIICGLLSIVISIQINLNGIIAFLFSIFISVIFSTLSGILYGKLLNNMKGDEMTVGTYIGFSFVSLMSIFWIILPFNNTDMTLAIGGKGLRSTISLEKYFGNILNTYENIVLFIFICFILYIFFNTKSGIAMKTSGSNPKYAISCGININKYRILGIILSNILASIGIIIYSLSYGYIQLYQAPLMMPFSSVASILLGGATIKKASILNAIIGVCIVQSLNTISTPLINSIINNSSFSDAIRILLSYGIILYALVMQGGNKNDI